MQHSEDYTQTPIRLIAPPKDDFSWPNELSKMNRGETVKAERKYANYITSLISRDMKLKEPENKYKTDQKRDPKYIFITRLN